jgi:hypothetical protein
MILGQLSSLLPPPYAERDLHSIGKLADAAQNCSPRLGAMNYLLCHHLSLLAGIPK